MRRAHAGRLDNPFWPDRQDVRRSGVGGSLARMEPMAGGIAHDFNNLLACILGAADAVLERELAGICDNSETLQDVREIRRCAQQGAALVRKLLNTGDKPLPGVLAVNDVLIDIAGLVRRLFGQRIRLEQELWQPGQRILADSTQLDRVLLNLAMNARDAMPDGGVLTLRSAHVVLTGPLEVATGTIPPGGYVTIEVQDSGAGIAPDVLPQIFEPLFTTRGDRGGNGLGLSTVRTIVGQCDGYVDVDTEPGRGTCMRIYLPCWKGAVDRPEALSELLLVDDEDALRRVAARALTSAGWSVLEAASGEAALALLHARPPGVPLTALVSDRLMPGMDGLTLVEEARRWLGQPDLPVVLMSGFADSPQRRGLNAATSVFLMKPFLLADLVAAVGKICGTPRLSHSKADALEAVIPL